MEGVDTSAVEAYLVRIGAARPRRPDLDALTNLQERHLDTVPFENLSIHLGEPIVLEADALVDKVVRRRRGGFCYELNGAFSALLEALGFRVTLMAARVYGADGSLGPPYDHLVLRVDLDEAYLVDVGFGAFARRPLLLHERREQVDPAGRFRLVEAERGDLDVLMDGTPVYRFELRPRELADFEATCWWQQTSPASHFAQSLTCSLPTADGRVTLSGDRLIRTEDGRRTERRLESGTEVLAAYESLFGIHLDRLPHDPASGAAAGA
jgi:N-hydroxyarylamine O-acetyltransferase